MINIYMIENKDTTESQIFNAAREIFEEKGLSGARMQEIADKAGINKSLLHYYYRSKEKLFHSVFQIIFKKLMKEFIELFDSDDSVENKIRNFFNLHISILQKNPNIPVFVLNEINQNPERVLKMMKGLEVEKIYKKLFKQIHEGIERGEMRQVEPEQVLVSILSMSIFPFAAKEMLKGLLNMDAQQFNAFLDRRKTEAADFVINALMIKK
ncbi:MAG: TetR/AcrR family transcriptional regulator [Bacteroidales bacterium]|nr:TetR/AcrR family transcriptional regulator [Bacteroidales bacterium]